jgi:hypothetical protein
MIGHSLIYVPEKSMHPFLLTREQFNHHAREFYVEGRVPGEH